MPWPVQQGKRDGPGGGGQAAREGGRAVDAVLTSALGVEEWGSSVVGSADNTVRAVRGRRARETRRWAAVEVAADAGVCLDCFSAAAGWLAVWLASLVFWTCLLVGFLCRSQTAPSHGGRAHLRRRRPKRNGDS